MDQIQLDWDLKNLETKSTHQVCSAYYPAKRGHSQQGIPFPWTGSSIQKLYGCFPGFFIHPPSHPHDVKEHMIHHTRPTSVVQFWCSDSYCWPYTQPLLPTCISEPWPPMTHMLVHHCSLLGALLIETDKCRPGTLHWSYSFGDGLT